MRIMWWFVLVLFGCVQQHNSQIIYTKEPNRVTYQIVGLFEAGAEIQRRAFNESIDHAKSGNLRLEPIILQPSKTDSYSVWKELCSNQDIRPVAIFGPQSAISDGAIIEQSSIVQIPHVQATWQSKDPDIQLNVEEVTEEVSETETDEEETPVFKRITINFYPDANQTSVAYAKLLKYYDWKSFVVFYEDEFGLLRVQKILAEHTERYPVIIHKLDPNGDNIQLFKAVKYRESRILIDCHVERVMKYMNEARTLGMVNHYQHYILTVDASTLVDQLQVFKSNITWLSLTKYETLTDPQHFLSLRVGKWQSDKTLVVAPRVTKFQIEALIMDDIGNHLLEAIKNAGIEELPEKSPCEPDFHWTHGALLQDKILKTQTTGITGKIQFDDRGRRVNYTLYVNEIHVEKKRTIGRWESENDTHIIEEATADETTASKHFIVASRRAKPYFYEKEKCVGDCEDDDPNEQFEGFSVDLVKAIFKILKERNYNYTYEFSNVTKGYGTYDPINKKWNGLIGELLDKKLDLAVCDLTITEERKKVVDFSVPFMSLGISILYRQEKKVPPDTFSFLNPYSFEVWMYTATAYCVVSILLYVCSRISPADWENPQPCDKDPEELENIWNFKNCTWLTMGSIMTQGCDILPKAIGSRWVCGMWWFFAMIVCQTYIAQLAASLTSQAEDEPINNVEDLAKQSKILYGAINGGSTLSFFKNSQDKMFKKMYDNMISNEALLVQSNEEGERRVLSGNKYAFFMESCTIEYKLKRNCDLKKIGDELDSKDYGIAMPANSPFRSHINLAILKLKEQTLLENIKNKWWEQKYGAINCTEESNVGDVEGDLEMQHLIGVFLVLIVGLVICLFITAAEFLNEVQNIVVREQVTHKEAFIKELKASLNFFQLQKPVLRNPSRAASVASLKEIKQTNRANAIENFLDLEKEIL